VCLGGREGGREGGGGGNDRPSPSSANGSAPARSSTSQMPLAFLQNRSLLTLQYVSFDTVVGLF